MYNSTPTKSNTEKAVKLAELKNGTPVCRIEFPYNQEDLNRVRGLRERKYYPEGKYWTCPVDVPSLELLAGWGFKLDSNLQAILDRSKVSITDVKEIKIPGLKGTLRPFQNIGVSFIDAKNGRCLIADQMGLGKTITALAYLQLHKELRTAIIVVPASLKLNWLRETFNWIPNSQAEVLTGRTPYKTTGKILILNYDILEAWVPYLIKIKPKILIMDEVHCIKNGAAKRTKAAKKLGKVVEHIIGLSGTPVLNRPIEIYNAVSMIDPTVLGSYFVFTKRYCDAKKSIWGTNVQGASNVEELHRKLTSTVMLRRLKVNVAKDLPDKQTAFVPIELDNWAEYVYAERNFIKWVSETKGTAAAIRASNAETLGQINALKQLAVKGKMANVISWIEEFIDSGEKLVLFCTHTATIDAIMTAFPKISVRYDGGVNQSNRDKAVTSFQTDVRIKLFVGMLDAAGNPAGVGLTLTAAWSTATIEYQYTPGVHDQADDRIHRIGQKNACTNYKLIAAGTIEEKIAALLDKKRQIVDGILDGKRTPAESLLMELIKSYQK